VPYEPGTVKAISKKDGRILLTKEIKTAGKPARIILSADRNSIHADGKDLSFVTVKIVDANGTLVPNAANEIHFNLIGQAFIAGVDDGNETNMELFNANHHKAFNGLCLVVIQSNGKAGNIQLSAVSEGLQNIPVTITSK
jgi:beta-galactosidase